MSERATLLIIRFVGYCALISVLSIGISAILGNPIDVACSNLASAAVGGLVGMMMGHARKPEDPTPTKPAPATPPPAV